MMNDTPFLLSIITPCLNRVQYIDEAIQSVLQQGYSRFEHIIVDGGSTDGTLDALRKHLHLRIVSERDNGMYDALNKGLAISNGDIVGFLNTDDLFAPALVEAVKPFADGNVMAVAGRAEIFAVRPNGAIEIMSEFSPEKNTLLELSTTGSPFFNAWFFRRSVFEKLGKFNARYRIAADCDFMLRLAISNMKYSVIDSLVYRYRHHEGSMTFDLSIEKLEKVVREHLDMMEYRLHQPGISESTRLLMRKGISAKTLHLAIFAIEKQQYAKFYLGMFHGLRHDPLWLFKFMQYATRNPSIFKGFFTRTAS